VVRLDMSEYMEPHSVARLIGAPPGYIGHEEGGQLTEKVRRNPYCIVLLDEVEKAHKQVLNVLLQVLDDGRLTDSQGRVVDFSNCIVIMTSNLGARFLTEDLKQQAAKQDDAAEKSKQGSSTRSDSGSHDSFSDVDGLGEGDTISEHAREQAMTCVRQHFAPEFINRLDDVVMFKPLTRTHMKQIIQLQVNSVMDRLAQLGGGVGAGGDTQAGGDGIQLDVKESALATVLKRAYSSEYGARPLRRYIESNLVTPLSRMMIAGQVRDGVTVEVTGGNKGLKLEVRKSPPEGKAEVKKQPNADAQMQQLMVCGP